MVEIATTETTTDQHGTHHREDVPSLSSHDDVTTSSTDEDDTSTHHRNDSIQQQEEGTNMKRRLAPTLVGMAVLVLATGGRTGGFSSTLNTPETSEYTVTATQRVTLTDTDEITSISITPQQSTETQV
jgi:hypothetical protein